MKAFLEEYKSRINTFLHDHNILFVQYDNTPLVNAIWKQGNFSNMFANAFKEKLGNLNQKSESASKVEAIKNACDEVLTEVVFAMYSCFKDSVQHEDNNALAFLAVKMISLTKSHVIKPLIQVLENLDVEEPLKEQGEKPEGIAFKATDPEKIIELLNKKILDDSEKIEFYTLGFQDGRNSLLSSMTFESPLCVVGRDGLDALEMGFSKCINTCAIFYKFDNFKDFIEKLKDDLDTKYRYKKYNTSVSEIHTVFRYNAHKYWSDSALLKIVEDSFRKTLKDHEFFNNYAKVNFKNWNDSSIENELKGETGNIIRNLFQNHLKEYRSKWTIENFIAWSCGSTVGLTVTVLTACATILFAGGLVLKFCFGYDVSQLIDRCFIQQGNGERNLG